MILFSSMLVPCILVNLIPWSVVPQIAGHSLKCLMELVYSLVNSDNSQLTGIVNHLKNIFYIL